MKNTIHRYLRRNSTGMSLFFIFKSVERSNFFRLKHTFIPQLNYFSNVIMGFFLIPKSIRDEYWMWLKTSAFNSVTLAFIGKQFLISFKILMLHAILESILLISSLKFYLLSSIIPRYLTDDDSPMFTSLILRWDGVRAFFDGANTIYSVFLLFTINWCDWK